MTIPLVVDDTGSFSLFTLPFAYCPVPLNNNATSARYKPAALENIAARRAYFTRETASVLYDRSRHFVLHVGEDIAPVNNYAVSIRDDVSHLVQIAAPRIILFEYGDKRNSEEMQVGFLVLKATFLTRSPEDNASGAPWTLDDLLVFNELFRYWVAPYEEHRERSRYRDVTSRFPRSLDEYLGNAPIQRNGEMAPECPYFHRWNFLLDVPFEADGKAWRLFPQSWSDQAEAYRTSFKGDCGWSVYQDNRTYVASCAHVQNHQEANGFYAIQKKLPRDEALAYWVKFLNIDSSDPGQSCTAFEKQWIESRTYRRWEHYGTLYGFTYYSASLLASPSVVPIERHFREMYFDQAMLLLYIRVALFRFSAKIHNVSSQARDQRSFLGLRSNTRFTKEFNALRWRFMLFTNLYQFPLLSNQQQAVEMYAMQRLQFDIDDLFSEVQREIENTDGYLDMRGINRLSNMAALAAPSAIVLALFSLDILSGQLNEKPILKVVAGWGPSCLDPSWLVLIVIIALMVLSTLVTLYWVRKPPGK